MLLIIKEPCRVNHQLKRQDTNLVADESTQVAKHFTSGAKTYSFGAQLQHAVAEELMQKMPLKPSGLTLDLGCGPGLFTQQLQSKSDKLISFDLSMSMLRQGKSAVTKIQGNSHCLPFLPDSFDQIFSSLMVQWCDLERVLEQVHHVLKPGGCAYISTLIQGSLCELEQAWQAVDNDQHIHEYLSRDELILTVNRAGFGQVSVQQHKHEFWFESVKGLAKELKMLGANYVKNRQNKGLITKSKWQTMESAYRDNFYSAEKDAIPASYQVVLIELKK